MKHMYVLLALTGIILTAIVAAYPHRMDGKGAPTAVADKGYSTKMKDLRARFNQDRGKVRLLLLLSPT